MIQNQNPQPTFKLKNFGLRGAIAVGADLVSTAKEEVDMPRVLAKAASRIEKLHQKLVQAAHVRQDPVLTRQQREAQHDEVVAWKAFRGSVESWSLLEAEGFAQRVEAAKKIATAIFESRPPIARLPYTIGWYEAEARLTTIATQDLEDPIRAIGAGPFLDRVRETHEASGAILGITQRKKRQPAKESVRRLIQDLRKAISEYAVMVEAHSLSRQQGAKDRAQRLMAPIVEWQTSSAKRRPKKAEPSSTTPAPMTALHEPASTTATVPPPPHT
jgi:hypothetical protein